MGGWPHMERCRPRGPIRPESTTSTRRQKKATRPNLSNTLKEAIRIMPTLACIWDTVATMTSRIGKYQNR
jgi:hypothetical protein